MDDPLTRHAPSGTEAIRWRVIASQTIDAAANIIRTRNIDANPAGLGPPIGFRRIVGLRYQANALTEIVLGMIAND
jgi:hypothetical protein